MDFETVIYEVKRKVCYITINRPEKRNALNFQLLDDLDGAFDKAEGDNRVKVVVLKGNGPAFCSGYDLNDSLYLKPPEGGWTYKGSLTI